MDTMDKIALADKRERQAIFTDTAAKANLNKNIVEKDFWVSWTLGKIFSAQKLNEMLCFKGGTSLSKVFGIIERFSEDIDLILAQSTVMKNGEELIQASHSKQERFNAEIEKRAGIFISNELKKMISNAVSSVCTVETDDNDNHILHIIFPKTFNYEYIQPTIKLEIGPLALWNPNEKYPIKSFVGEYQPALGLNNPIITTIKPERTFWEKITILHQEANRPPASPVPLRYSRHFYDIYKMAQTEVKTKAFQDLTILKEVASFKSTFYPRKWAKYEEACPGTMKLLPSDTNLKIFEDDYKKMERMIYGEIPSWSEIIKCMKKLEKEITNL